MWSKAVTLSSIRMDLFAPWHTPPIQKKVSKQTSSVSQPISLSKSQRRHRKIRFVITKDRNSRHNTCNNKAANTVHCHVSRSSSHSNCVHRVSNRNSINNMNEFRLSKISLKISIQSIWIKFSLPKVRMSTEFSCSKEYFLRRYYLYVFESEIIVYNWI